MMSSPKSPISLRKLTYRSATLQSTPTDAPIPDTPSRSHYKAIRPLLSTSAFVSESKLSDIRLYDKVPQSKPQTFSSSDDFEAHLTVTPKPHTRVVSICCQSSMDPLGITESAMQKLTDLYEIDNSFIDHAVLFGDKPRTSDAGHGEMTVKERADGSFDMHYRFTYTDSYRLNVEGPTKFTDRQVCVFHRHNPPDAGNLWIFLHARPKTDLQIKLEQTLAKKSENGTSDWASLHLLVFATYIGKWRWCLRNFGEQIEAAADVALTMDLSDLEVVSDNKNLGSLLHPQYLVNRIMSFSSQIGVTLATVRKMAEMNGLFLSRGLTTDAEYRRLADTTDYYTSSLEGYIKSVGALEKKVQGFSNLLATNLTLYNQARMLQLADASVEDNANVFVVTVVTLFYLPASFVSTFLGMNFFDFNSPHDGEFATSKKIWIFFVAAGPLTCLTVGFWYLLTKQRERTRKRARPAS